MTNPQSKLSKASRLFAFDIRFSFPAYVAGFFARLGAGYATDCKNNKTNNHTN